MYNIRMYVHIYCDKQCKNGQHFNFAATLKVVKCTYSKYVRMYVHLCTSAVCDSACYVRMYVHVRMYVATHTNIVLEYIFA